MNGAPAPHAPSIYNNVFMSQLICSKCGKEIEPVRMRGEESVVRLSDGNILAANRWFDGECPQCGPVLQNKMGHHGTIQTKRMKELLPNAKLNLLRSKLSDGEFRRLRAAREGKQSVSEEELNRWLKMVE